ncbi:MAG: type II toxin-antitoxin system PemK/MazF family toxin [Candidatus Diapherotrites archaeon]|nr:type II toxin-antitoxin system PemK/MazF family toxin [Candidatus Diapherotrites archaeon]
MNSSNFEQGEIVVAPIPFSTHTSGKIRPTLVISKKEYNNKSEDIIVLKITSKVKDYPFDIDLKENNLISGTLKQESVIQADFPVVIEKTSVSQKIGKISEQKLKEVKQKLKELYEL